VDRRPCFCDQDYYRHCLWKGRFGSVAVIEYIPKAAGRTAGIGGIADLAIRGESQVLESNTWNRLVYSGYQWRAEWETSDIHLFGHFERIIYLNAQVADRAVEFGVSQQ